MANIYRVANGNWNAANSWAGTDGGTDYVSAPTSSDDAFFTALTPTGTHTMNTNGSTLNLNFTGFTGTFDGSFSMSVYGNLVIATGMTFSFNAYIRFRGTGTHSITSNGKVFACYIEIEKGSGTIQLADGLTLSHATPFVYTSGTFDPNSQTVTLTAAGAVNLNSMGSSSFYNLTRTGTAVKTDTFVLGANQTVTNTFTVTGNSAINRVLVKSSVLGTARTITAAAVSVDKTDFQDITGAGAASWDMSAAAGYTGDCGGNTMKALGTAAFTAAATCNWSSGSTWSTATWSNHSIPLPQDTATFTTAGTATITQDMPRIGAVNFSTVSGAKTWTTNTACSFFGSINITNLTALSASTQTYTYEGRGSSTLTSGGITWPKLFTINAPNGTLTLGDAFVSNYASDGFTVTAGTFTTGNYNMTFDRLNATASTTSVINLGSSLITLTNSTSNPITLTGSGLTLNAGTSTIKFTGTLSANRTMNFGSRTYYNFWNASTGAFAIIVAGSNTFTDFRSDGSRTINFTAGTTQTVTTFTTPNTVGNVVTINSTTTATHALVKAGGGTISCDYLNIQHSVATPASTWYAGTNSTNNQADVTAGSGWIFTAVPVAGNSSSFLAFM